MNSKGKREFSRATIEIIRFEKQDIITTSGGEGLTEFSGTAEGPANTPGPNPPIPVF